MEVDLRKISPRRLRGQTDHGAWCIVLRMRSGR
jgi:hypothetical protein